MGFLVAFAIFLTISSASSGIGLLIASGASQPDTWSTESCYVTQCTDGVAYFEKPRRGTDPTANCTTLPTPLPTYVLCAVTYDSMRSVDKMRLVAPPPDDGARHRSNTVGYIGAGLLGLAVVMIVGFLVHAKLVAIREASAARRAPYVILA